ncbi:MAG: DUF1292 domain-containing protein [Myxococcota bacterium]
MAGDNDSTHELLDDEIEADVVELTDDEGNTVEFAVLLVVELEGVEYAALTPVDQLDEDAEGEQEVYLFVYETQEEDEGMIESFAPIEDEDTFAAVRDFCAAQIEVLAGA